MGNKNIGENKAINNRNLGKYLKKLSEANKGIIIRQVNDNVLMKRFRKFLHWIRYTTSGK
ncbi:MAG: hypothetical protein IRZ03_11065 [Acidobacterium ailaaui]|nr:hypothetical protein [Pseudacidobacterium ailaaui]